MGIFLWQNLNKPINNVYDITIKEGGDLKI
jgi:hypothetical protein